MGTGDSALFFIVRHVILYYTVAVRLSLSCMFQEPFSLVSSPLSSSISRPFFSFFPHRSSRAFDSIIAIGKRRRRRSRKGLFGSKRALAEERSSENGGGREAFGCTHFRSIHSSGGGRGKRRNSMMPGTGCSGGLSKGQEKEEEVSKRRQNVSPRMRRGKRRRR